MVAWLRGLRWPIYLGGLRRQRTTFPRDERFDAKYFRLHQQYSLDPRRILIIFSTPLFI